MYRFAALWLMSALLFTLQAFAVSDGVPGNNENSHRSVVKLIMHGDAKKHLCTATKITPTLFLTAAHCLNNFPAHGRRVVEISQESRNSSFLNYYGRGAITVVRIYVPDLVAQATSIVEDGKILKLYQNHDIAVLEVALKDQDVRIPSQAIARESAQEDELIYISGYGRIAVGENPESLNVSQQRVWKFERETKRILIKRTKEFQALLQRGDSGGSCSRKNVDGSWEIIGVNSTYGAETSGLVDITAHLDFLDQVMSGIGRPVYENPL